MRSAERLHVMTVRSGARQKIATGEASMTAVSISLICRSVSTKRLCCHVAAHEEIALCRFRPHSRPGQRYDMAVLVNVARLKIAQLLAAASEPHLVAGRLEI